MTSCLVWSVGSAIREKKGKREREGRNVLVLPLRGTHATIQFWGQVESEILPPNFRLKVVWQERTMEKLLISLCSR